MSSSQTFHGHQAVVVGRTHPWFSTLPMGATGMRAVYGEGGIHLMVVFEDLSDADVRKFREGESRFGLIRLRGGYCWLLRNRIGALDAPYSPCIEPPENRDLPWSQEEATPLTRAFISVHLIDTCGVARALKGITVSPFFTRRLEAMHAAALREGLPGCGWDREIARFCAIYPTPQAAFKDASVTCAGGE